MTTGATDGYRPCVGLMMFAPDGRVFVARRIDTQIESWQMPQGGIDPGETPRIAALRELREEIGTDKAEIIGESAGWLDYDLPEEFRHKVWGGRWRGQSQKWFLLRFVGHDSDIDIKTEHPEFSAWKWVPPNSLLDLIVEFKRPIYEAVIAEFRELIENATAAK